MSSAWKYELASAEPPCRWPGARWGRGPRCPSPWVVGWWAGSLLSTLGSRARWTGRAHIRHGGVVLPRHEPRGLGRQRGGLHVLGGSWRSLLSIQARPKYEQCQAQSTPMVLPLEVRKALMLPHRDSVGARTCPSGRSARWARRWRSQAMGLHGGGGWTLEARPGGGPSRDHLDLHIQPVLLEDAHFVGQRERGAKPVQPDMPSTIWCLRLRGRGPARTQAAWPPPALPSLQPIQSSSAPVRKEFVVAHACQGHPATPRHDDIAETPVYTG